VFCEALNILTKFVVTVVSSFAFGTNGHTDMYMCMYCMYVRMYADVSN